MTAEILSLRKSDIDKAFELVKEYQPKKIVVILLTQDEQVEYIAPTDMSVYEVAGWLEAVKQDLLNS